jgi:hypothetical protein
VSLSVGGRIWLPFLSIHEWLFPFQDICESGQQHACAKGMVPVGNQATTVPLMLAKNSWVLLCFLFSVFGSCKTSSTRFPACCVAWILGHISHRAPTRTSRRTMSVLWLHGVACWDCDSVFPEAMFV